MDPLKEKIQHNATQLKMLAYDMAIKTPALTGISTFEHAKIIYNWLTEEVPISPIVKLVYSG